MKMEDNYARQIWLWLMKIMNFEKNKKIPIEMDHELRAHWEEIKRKAIKGGSRDADKELLKEIEKVFKLEMDNQRKLTLNNLNGKDEQEMVQKIEMMKLKTQPDDS